MIQKTDQQRLSRRHITAGWFLRSGQTALSLCVFLFLLVYFPFIRKEAEYLFRDPKAADAEVSFRQRSFGSGTAAIVPIDASFSVVIPTLGVNAPVESQTVSGSSVGTARRPGSVMHHTDSPVPSEPGETVLSALAGSDFVSDGKFATAFALLHRLKTGDRIVIAYRGVLYPYRVSETFTLPAGSSPRSVSDSRSVTLISSWPPGRNDRRFYVRAISDPAL